MRDLKHVSTTGWLLMLSLIGLGVYFPGRNIQYFSDDFQLIFNPLPPHIFYYFFHNNPVNYQVYRPIQASFLVAVQTYWGLNTLPIHLTALSLHILLSWLLFVTIIRMGFSRLQAIIGSVFMMISQANAHALLSNDTISQLSGTYFGCLSLWCLSRSLLCHQDAQGHRHDGMSGWASMLSVVTFALALLSKETSFSFFPMVLVILLLKKTQSRHQETLLKSMLIGAAPYVMVIGFYFIARWLTGEVQPRFGFGVYDFRVGLNVIKNLAMFWFAALVPVSSVTVFTALKSRDVATLAITVLVFLGFCTYVAYGLWRVHRPRLAMLFGMCATIGFFPVAMMNHVSELYVYNSMPFIAILVGIGVGRFFELIKGSALKYYMSTVFASILVISHIMAIQSKASLMKHNGEQATHLLGSLKPYLERVPQHGELWLLNPPDDQVEYSVFRINGFNVLKHGINRIKQLSGRDDFEIKIVEQAELAHTRSQQNALILSLHGGTVAVYQAP